MARKKVEVNAVLTGLSTVLNGLSKIADNMNKVSGAVSVTDNRVKVFSATLDRATNQWTYANGKVTTAARLQERLAQSFGVVSQAAQASVSGLAALTNEFVKMTGSATQADQELQNKPDDMGQTGSASIDLSGILSILAGKFGMVANAALGLVRGGLDLVIGSMMRVGDAITGAIGKFVGFWAQIGKTAIAFALGNVITKLGSQIKEMSMEILRTTGQFQLLEIRMRTIAARDLVKAGGIPMTEALAQAQVQARGLLEWVRRIAVTTPFPTEHVAQSLALANAYGLTAGEAQVLTSATLDFAAAMGLTDEHIYRIIYNFGQMQQQGKLTGREFRDLAISFVPVHDVIREMAEEAGTTAEAMEQMALQGGVPVEAFFKKFTEMVNRDFKGAAEAAAKTLTGLADNFKDIVKTTLGLDVLGQLGKTVAGALNDVLDAMRTDEFRLNAQIIGGVLNSAFIMVARVIRDELLPALGLLGNALGFVGGTAEDFQITFAAIGFGIRDGVRVIVDIVKKLTEWFANTLGKVQENGHSWGYNLIANFAKGMANAVKLIAKVIVGIANFIAGWFKPGSPPKVAKEIRTWGQGLMREYGQGIGEGTGDVAERITDLGRVMKENAERRAGAAGKSAGAALARDFRAEAIAAVQPLVQEFGAEVMAGIGGSFNASQFTMFKDIADLASGFIRSLSDRVISEEGVIPRILGTRKAVAEAIDGLRRGSLSVADAVGKITKAMGNVPVGMGKYISSMIKAERAQVNLDNAQEISLDTLSRVNDFLSKMSGGVKTAAKAYVSALRDITRAQTENQEAELALARVTEFYDDKLRSLKAQLESVTQVYDEQRQLKEIDAALSSGLLTTEERERLEMEKRAILLKAQIRETEAQRDIEVDAAKDRAEASKVALDLAEEEASKRKDAMINLAEAQAQSAKDQVEAARMLIEMQTEQNNLIQEQIDLLARLAESKAGAGADMETEGGGLGDLGPLGLPTPEEIQAKVDEIMRLGEARFNAWKDRIKKAIANAFGYESWTAMVNDFRNKFVAPIVNAATTFKNWWTTNGPIVREYIDGVAIGLGILGETASGITTSLGEVITPLNILKLTFGGIYMAMSLVNGVFLAFGRAMKFVSDVTETFEPFWQMLYDSIAKAATKVDEAKGAFEKLGAILEYVGTVVYAMVTTPFVAIAELIMYYYALIIGFTSGFVDGIIEFFQKLFDRLVGGSIVPEMMTSIYDWMTGKLTEISTFVSEKLEEIKTAWENAKKFVYDKAVYYWNRIYNTISEKIKAAKAYLENRLKEIKAFWDENWGKVRDKIVAIWNDKDGIIQNIKDGIDAINTWFYDKLKPIIDDAIEWFDKLEGGIVGAANGIARLITQIGELISAVLSGDFARMRDAIHFITGSSPSPLAIGAATATQEIRRLSKEIKAFEPTFNARMADTSRYGGITNNRTVQINVDANYAQTESPVSIYYDITAALSTAGI